MSGIFGIIDPDHTINVDIVAKAMACRLKHRPWFIADYQVDEPQGIAFGRVGIGIFNQTTQPVWNHNNTIALVMAGEFYNFPHQPTTTINSHEQFALRLYEKHGSDFVHHLNGAFIIGIWDLEKQQFLIANDRFGLYPLFIGTRRNKLLFASEMKAVFCDTTFPHTLDLTALAEYIRFQHLLGNRSFFEDISLFPSGSLLTYHLNEATYTVQTYWDFADIPYLPQVSFDEAVEEAGFLLERAIKRFSSDSYRPGVYLSGGLDSRIILGLIDRRPVASLSYGVANCADVHYGHKIAEKVGSYHHWVDLPNGNWVKHHADFHMAVTEGYHSWIHAHGISTLPLARQVMDVNLTGWDGGTVMGHADSIEPLQIHAVNDAALTTRLFYLFNQKYTWPSMTEAEESLLYTPAYRPQLQGRAFESFQQTLKPYFNYRPDVRGEYFYVRNHCARLTQNLITFTRSHIEVRFPFFDYDLFDFLYGIPAQIRGHRKLYYALLQQKTPTLAHITYSNDGYLPTPPSLLRSGHMVYRKVKNRFNKYMPWLVPPHPSLYADYEQYLRTDLKRWAEQILFDPHALNHQYFDSSYVQTLFDHHVAGYEEWTIGKIAPLITYEMMLKQFCA